MLHMAPAGRTPGSTFQATHTCSTAGSPYMLQQVKAQNYMNYDLISVGKSMTFYLSCHFPSGLMSLCSREDAFQPQGPIMNSQKSSPKLL